MKISEIIIAEGEKAELEFLRNKNERDYIVKASWSERINTVLWFVLKEIDRLDERITKLEDYKPNLSK